ncbi:MAG TPA: DUF3168 domain-containing protein [Allosphingosinicella sp.]|uniref:tail completion protein gp17 n=1 Tax=Allosphingosinicella sp. TaxID=2823234 RepID=UPI002ED7A2B9
MSAGEKLQAAAIAALKAMGRFGVYEGPPVQAVMPHAIVEAGPESDWSHKSGAGREVRLAVTLKDVGERPVRLRALMDEAEAALEGLAPDGWQLVTMRMMRSGMARDAKGVWTGASDYRARMLKLE